MTLRIHFEEVPQSEPVREECERWARDLQSEFPEAAKFEVSITQAGAAHETHVRVTGKDLELVSTGENHGVRESLTEAFERVRRQLRKHHDKQIFSRRREAQRNTSS